jgi:hypothetical protein
MKVVYGLRGSLVFATSSSQFVAYVTLVTDLRPHITDGRIQTTHNCPYGGIVFVLRLDYLSCVLTISSTILVGRRCWEGWLLATVNSFIMCVIGIKTAQLGFIPANVFCIVMSAINLRAWRRGAILP